MSKCRNGYRTMAEILKFEVGEREAQILATYLGNDLQKVVNELGKVKINVPDEHVLTAAMIQKYIRHQQGIQCF